MTSVLSHPSKALEQCFLYLTRLRGDRGGGGAREAEMGGSLGGGGYPGLHKPCLGGKGLGAEHSWALWGTLLCNSGVPLHALKYLPPAAGVRSSGSLCMGTLSSEDTNSLCPLPRLNCWGPAWVALEGPGSCVGILSVTYNSFPSLSASLRHAQHRPGAPSLLPIRPPRKPALTCWPTSAETPLPPPR